MSLGPQFSGDRQQAVNLPDPVVLQVVDPNHPIYDPIYAPPASTFGLKRTLLLTTAFSLAVGLLGIAGLIITKNQSDLAVNQKDTYATSAIPLSEVTPESILGLAQLGKLDINGRVQVNGALVLTPQEQPTDVTPGTIYYDKTTNQVYYYNGQDYRQVADTTNTITSLAGQTGAIALGQGLSLANGILSSSINPQDLDLTLTAGTGIAVTNGTTITNTGVTGISSQTGNIALGRGLTMSGNTLTSTTTLVSSNPGVLVVTEPTPGNYSIGFAGAGLSGTVQLGPVSAQIDSAATPSLFVNKTTPGELLHFQNNGVDAFTVSQTGVITNGSIAYSQVSGAPLTTVTGIDAASGAITLGSGLLMTGNVLSVNIAGPSGNYIDDDTVQQTANFNIRSGNAGWVTSTISGTTAQAVNILEVRATGTANPLFSVGPAGTALFQPSANSLSSFRIYNSDASKLIFNIDSTNGRVGIGTATPAYDLDVIGDINASNSILVGGSPVCTTSGCLTQAQAGQFVANTYQLTPSHPENLALITGFNTQPTATLQAASGQTSNLLQLQDTSGNKTLAISTSGSIDFYNTAGTFKGSIVFQTPIANATYTIPADATGGEFCIKEIGNCSGGGGGAVTGSGTGGKIPVFSGAGASTNVTDSILTQSANTITLAGDLTVTQAGGITIGTPSSVNGLLRLANSTNGNLTTIQPLASAPSGTIDLRLPNTSGTLAVGVVNGGALSYDPTTGLIDCIGCVTTGGGSGASGVDSVNARTGAVVFDNTTFVGLTGKLTIDDASTTQKGIAQFNSTNFSSALGVVNTIQNINSTATPTFSTLSLTGSNTLALGTSSTATGSVVFRNNANANTLSLVPAATTGGNKTITLPDNSGTVAVAASGNINLSANGTLSLTGQVPVSGGGTGIGTFATNGILFGNGTGAIGATAAAGGAGQCLISTAGAPIWSSCAGAGTGVSLQAAYANSTPATIDLNDTNGGLTVRDNATPITGNLFGVQSSGGGTTYLSVTTGGTTIRNSLTLSSISTTGVLQTNASGLVSSSRLNLADTVNLVTGTVGVGSGGTGGTTFTQYGVIYGNNAGALGITNAGSTGNCLVSNGGGSAPVWGSCATNPGSGVTLQATYNNSTPATLVLNATSGALLVQDNAVPIGGTLFAVQNNSGATSYLRVTAAGTTISNPVTISGLTTGVVQSNGSGLLSSSKLNLGDTANSVTGTVGVGSGGTGGTTFTQYGVLIGNNAGALTTTVVGTSGNCLVSNGGGSAPSWGSCASGSGSGVTLQAAYNNSSPAIIDLNGTNAGLIVRDNAAPIGTSLLAVQNSTGATSYLSVTPTATTLNGNLVVQGTGTITAISQTLTGASSLTLGTTGTNNGSVIFRSSTAASGTITLQGPASKNGTGQVITFPDASGVVCLDTGGCPLGSGNTSYIQNQIATDQAANYWIAGTGRAAALQAASLDTAVAGTLTLAGTNATAVTIGKTTTLSSGAGFTVVAGNTSLTGATTGNAFVVNNSTSVGSVADFQDNGTSVFNVADGGAVTAKNTVDSANAFRIQNSAGNNLLRIDSTNTALYVNENSADASLANGWSAGTALSTTSSYHSSVVLKGYLYVFGLNGNSTTVNYSAINSNGVNSAWSSTTALPNILGVDMNYAFTSGSYIYVFRASGTAVYVAKQNANGTLSAWTTITISPSLPSAPSITASSEGFVYATGSTAYGTSTYYGRFLPNGGFSGFTATTALPVGVGYHQMIAASGYVYVMGGFTAAFTNNNTLYYSQIQADGSLGAWSTTTSSGTPRTSAVAFVMNGKIYTSGGYYYSAGWQYRSDTRYASINSDGTLGSWSSTLATLPTSKSFMPVAVAGNYVYITGGWDSSANTTTVQIARFATTRINGSLDLLSGSGASLTNGSNSGALTAGNTSIIGSLEATGNTIIGGYASVGNGLTIGTIADGEVFRVQSADSQRWLGADTALNTFTVNEQNKISVSSWSNGSALGVNSTAHASVVVNGYVYKIGGIYGSASNDVRYSKIQADGTLGAWAVTTVFPSTTYRHSVATKSGVIYVGGGYGGGNLKYSRTNSNGTLGAWIDVSGAPTTAGSRITIVGNYMYIIGGYSAGELTNTYYAYINPDGTLGTWYVGPSLPAPNSDSSIAIINDTIYVISGYTSGTVATNTVFYAKPGLNGILSGWSTTTAPYPVANIGMSAEVSLGNIFVLGGTGSSSMYSAVPTATGDITSWTLRSSMPASNQGHSSVVYGGNIYVIGGATGYGNTYFASLPKTTIFGNISALNGTLTARDVTIEGSLNTTGDADIFGRTSAMNGLLVGTSSNGNAVQVQNSLAQNIFTLNTAENSLKVFENNPSAIGTFATTTSISTALEKHASVVVNGRVYVIGGHNGTNPVSTVSYSNINRDGTFGAWTTTVALPTTLYDHTAVTYNGYIYVIGGNNGTADVATVYYAKINTDGTITSWNTSTTSLTATMSGHSSVVYKNYLYAVTGTVVNYAAVNADGSLSTWLTATIPGSTRTNGLLLINNDVLSYVGGFDGTTQISTGVRATINANGSLSSWSFNSSLTRNTEGASALSANNYAYFLGGTNGSSTYDSYGFATFISTTGFTNIGVSSNGTLINAVREHSSVMYNGYVYIIGGHNGTTQTTSVKYASLARTQINGTLDLVSSVSPATSNSSVGRLIAGSTDVLGELTLLGSGALTVNGRATFNDSLTVKPVTNGVALSIQSANGGTFIDVNTSTNSFNINKSNSVSFTGTGIPINGAWNGIIDRAYGVEEYNGYVYVIGGYNFGAPVNTVYYSKIGSNSALGTFATTTSLPTAVYGAATSVSGGYLYIFGGYSGGGTTASYAAKINNDGTLGAWVAITSLPSSNYHHKVEYSNGYFFLSGGSFPGNTTTYSAKVYANGTISSWVATTALPTGISLHATSVVNGYLYIIGGQYNNVASTTVRYAKINANGTLSSWTSTSSLVSSNINFATQALAINGTMYSFNYATNERAYAKINNDGTLGTWVASATTPIIGNGGLIVGSNLYGFHTGSYYEYTLPRTQINGALDLVGGSGGNLTDNNGSGELIAGNTQVVGELTVTSTATIANGLSVTDGGLNVFNDAATGYATTIRNVNTGTDADGLLIDLGVDNASRTTSNYFIGFSGSGTIAGKIQGGASTVAYTTSGADYAEYFKAPIGTGMPTSGELVALDPTTNQGVVRATATGGTSTLPLTGIVSTSPGFIGNGPVCNVDDNDCDTNYAKYNALVALSGQVPTKVNTSNGPIAIGDPITISTTPGQGAKATTNGYIVGYAMEPLTTGSATIKVLVRPESYNQTNTNPSLNSLQGSDLTITGSTNLQGDVTIGANLNVTGAVTLSSLTVTGNTTITGNLTVQSITTTNLIVNGHIVSGGNTPTVNVGTAAGQGATATITGTDTAGTITVTTGTSNLTAGELVRITFASPYTKAPIVSLTAGNQQAINSSYYYDTQSANSSGYGLSASAPLIVGEVYIFTYQVIE